MATKTKDKTSIYEATATGVISLGGTLYTYVRGRTRVRAGHPLLKAIPEKFRISPVDYEIEQATAAPGEKRGA